MSIPELPPPGGNKQELVETFVMTHLVTPIASCIPNPLKREKAMIALKRVLMTPNRNGEYLLDDYTITLPHYVASLRNAILDYIDLGMPFRYMYIYRYGRGEPRLQYLIDYKGKQHLAYASGWAMAIHADCVFEGQRDDFYIGYREGNFVLEHNTATKREGEIVLTYAFAKLKTGEYVFEVMDEGEMLAAWSNAGTWDVRKEYPIEMRKKTCKARLFRTMPSLEDTAIDEWQAKHNEYLVEGDEDQPQRAIKVAQDVIGEEIEDIGEDWVVNEDG